MSVFCLKDFDEFFFHLRLVKCRESTIFVDVFGLEHDWDIVKFIGIWILNPLNE